MLEKIILKDKNLVQIYKRKYTSKSFENLYLDWGIGIALHSFYKHLYTENKQLIELNMHLFAHLTAFWKYKCLLVENIELLPGTNSPVYSENLTHSSLYHIYQENLVWIGNLHTHPPNFLEFSDIDENSFKKWEEECRIPVLVESDFKENLSEDAFVSPEVDKIIWYKYPKTHQIYSVNLFWGIIIPFPFEKENLNRIKIYYKVDPENILETKLGIKLNPEKAKVKWVKSERTSEYAERYLQTFLNVYHKVTKEKERWKKWTTPTFNVHLEL